MGDYVFKVKLLLADLSYPAFYYRQSICEDKLNCCFQDLRNELMRRYDLCPSLDVKGNFELQWYCDGDMITISNNDDLNVFMGLKGTRLVVVRKQMAGNFYGFNWQFTPQFNPQFANTTALNNDKDVTFKEFDGFANGFSPSISNTKTKQKSITNSWAYRRSVPLNARVHNEKSGEISKTVQLPHQSNTPFTDAIHSNFVSGIDVSHVDNDQPKHTAKPSVLGDSSAIPDSVSENASIHVGDDQSKVTNADQEIIPRIRSSILEQRIGTTDPGEQFEGYFKPIGSLLKDSNLIFNNLDDVDGSVMHIEGDQSADASFVQENVPQIISPISDLQAVTAVASLVRDSSSILDWVSVNVRVLGEDDQTKNTSAIQEIVPQIMTPTSDLRTVDPGVNVENDQHTQTIVKSIVGGQSEWGGRSTPRKTTLSSSVPSQILSHKEVMAKLENMLQYRSKQHPTQPPQHPINFLMPAPQLPTSAQAPELSAQAPELSAQAPDLSAQAPERLTYAPELPTKTLPTSLPEIPKLGNVVHHRFKERLQQPPLRPLNFSLPPPELPTPESQLPDSTKHANPRVQAALNTMTSQMKFSNSGGWLERLLEAVDGDIDEAMRKLQPKMQLI